MATSSATRLASSPFNKPEADIILRSGGGVDFCVRRHILFEASPVFESILSIPQPSTDLRPIVELAEDERTIDILLRICYPVVRRIAPSRVEDVELAVKAAQKYEMELPLSVLTDELLELAKTSPLAVWAVGCRTGLKRVVRRATSMLKEPLEVEVEHLVDISAGDYFRLLEFHRKGGRSVENSRPSVWSEASPEISAPTTMSFPLDMPQPDLVCVSSDGVEFPVHKACVGSASSVLRERITKASDIAETGHPILSFTEQSGLLADVLGLCYPDKSLLNLPTNPSKLADILVALDRYKMGTIRLAVFRVWEMVARSHPIQAYLAASRGHLRDCAGVAAECALQHPIEGEYVADMEFSPALDYHNLLVYHASCRTIVKRVLRSVLPAPASRADPEPAENSSRVQTEALRVPVQPRPHTKPRNDRAGPEAIRTLPPVPVPLRVSQLQDTWFRSYIESPKTKADSHWDNFPSSLTAFKMAVIEEHLWCPSCHDFARKLSAADAAVEDIRGQIENVPLKLTF